MENEGKKVLIVEDNAMNMMLVRDILTINGYEIIEAVTGAEAIRLVAGEHPDIILMDLHLPGMDGITATRLLKAEERFKEIPILAITASASSTDVAEILGRGFDGCVTKPIDVELLLGEVRRFTSKVEAPRD
ncbi:MAG: response regulator [Thermodesulfobacteriota bacterium]